MTLKFADGELQIKTAMMRTIARHADDLTGAARMVLGVVLNV